MDDHVDTHSHLLQLAAELKRRDWPTRIHRFGKRLALKVTNPADEKLNESIVCSAGDDGPVYRIPDGQVLGAVSDIECVADRRQELLRSVGV